MLPQQKKRFKRVCLVTGIAALLVVAYGVFYNLAGFGLPCVWEITTGFQCAGCGMTRATAALLRLDFKTAFSYNAVWPLYIGYVAWVVPAMTIPYVKEGRPINFPRPIWVHYVLLGIILLYGVLRNFI